MVVVKVVAMVVVATAMAAIRVAATGRWRGGGRRRWRR